MQRNRKNIISVRLEKDAADLGRDIQPLNLYILHSFLEKRVIDMGKLPHVDEIVDYKSKQSSNKRPYRYYQVHLGLNRTISKNVMFY